MVILGGEEGNLRGVKSKSLFLELAPFLAALGLDRLSLKNEKK
jgi:hypothetical protein